MTTHDRREEIKRRQRVIATATLCGCMFQNTWTGHIDGPWSSLGDPRFYPTQYEAAQGWLQTRKIEVA